MQRNVNIYTPHNYQEVAYQHIIDNLKCGLFLDMGLGKTVITLTAIKDLIYNDLDVTRVLVVAPKRVAQSVWSSEIEKWSHLQGLTISKVLGTEKKRKQALEAKADIYVINRENLVWLVGQYGGGKLPFDMLVIDELSSFKSHKSQRFKALKQVRHHFKRIVGLTGTPAPNGLMDLWAQMFILDGGERLFRTITRYRETYFKPGLSNGNVVYKYVCLPGSDEIIKGKISDICISMRSEDYLELPDIHHNYIKVQLPDDVMQRYKEFEKEAILEFIDLGIELDAVHAAALTNKLLQFSNGGVYYNIDNGPGKPQTRDWIDIHRAKVDEVLDIVEQAQGQPILIAYAFQFDVDKLMAELKSKGARVLSTEQDEKDWNTGKIPILITHPASAGHGLNLQYGGNIGIWYGETWSLELYQQFNKRLHRQGQDSKVIMHHIICENTEDERVVASTDLKAGVQASLIDGLAVRISEYKSLYR